MLIRQTSRHNVKSGCTRRRMQAKAWCKWLKSSWNLGIATGGDENDWRHDEVGLERLLVMLKMTHIRLLRRQGQVVLLCCFVNSQQPLVHINSACKRSSYIRYRISSRSCIIFRKSGVVRMIVCRVYFLTTTCAHFERLKGLGCYPMYV